MSGGSSVLFARSAVSFFSGEGEGSASVSSSGSGKGFNGSGDSEGGVGVDVGTTVDICDFVVIFRCWSFCTRWRSFFAGGGASELGDASGPPPFISGLPVIAEHALSVLASAHASTASTNASSASDREREKARELRLSLDPNVTELCTTQIDGLDSITDRLVMHL